MRTAIGILGLAVAACSGAQSSRSDGDRQRSVAAFERAAAVIEHPRCMNCHPRDDRPRWGEPGEIRVHGFQVRRGPGDHGAPGLPCSTCHGDDNFDPGGVPGHPHWGLAPLEMGWIGLGRGELCRALLDRERNGDRSLAEVVDHMVNDGLVAWAWQPGVRPDGTPRQPPPLAKPEFDRAIHAWAEAGAHCPD